VGILLEKPGARQTKRCQVPLTDEVSEEESLWKATESSKKFNDTGHDAQPEFPVVNLDNRADKRDRVSSGSVQTDNWIDDSEMINQIPWKFRVDGGTLGSKKFAEIQQEVKFENEKLCVIKGGTKVCEDQNVGQ